MSSPRLLHALAKHAGGMRGGAERNMRQAVVELASFRLAHQTQLLLRSVLQPALAVGSRACPNAREHQRPGGLSREPVPIAAHGGCAFGWTAAMARCRAEHLLCTGLRLMPRAIADPTVKLVRTRVPVWCGAFGLTRGADCLREERLVSARWFSSAPAAARLASNCNAKCAAGHTCRAVDAALPAGCISARYAPVYASIRALFNAPRS